MSWPGSSPSAAPCRGGPSRRKGDDHMCAFSPEPAAGSTPSRRGFLFRLGLALNVIGAALVGIPVIGYILAPARRLGGGEAWIKLGGVTKFPENETRLAIYENPFRVEW